MIESQIYSFAPLEIDCSGEWMLYPSSSDGDFKASIMAAGQLVPVLVEIDGSKAKLIAGRSRVAAAESLGLSVKAVAVKAGDDVSRALIHLEENRSRVADDALKLSVFRYLYTRMDKKELSQRVGPLLGIKPKARDMKLWLEWMELSHDFDGVLKDGNIPLAAVTVLSKLSDDDKATVLPYFQNLGWSRSNAVNFLTWLYETSRRDSKPVATILEENDLPLARENESPKDGVARLCKSAKQIRYPAFSELLKAQEKIVSEICVGTKWRVESVGNFETGEVMLQTRFKSREVMQRAIEDLSSIQKSGGWDELFELGREK
ncbi:ParB N-terminal domain-containing protein [Maridesulfovibrio frigidus]|uniref:ParB N-terminal domain-containing protein n=1 Tax=Maridesulfovibrio frigidus TaxID=340956 RepID=UPI0004E1AF33|nr:ParB N-terminal domain-containing protein [Maridesulfovibrio frigidus]